MSVELEELKARVHQKIGRNILAFQKIEIALKYLVTRERISGDSGQIKEKITEKLKNIDKITLGHLVNQFLGCSDFLQIENEPDFPKELWISCNVVFDIDIKSYQKRKDSLKMLVEERNQLVHHFFEEEERWDVTTYEGLKLAEVHLDEQYKKIQQEFQILKVEAELMQEGLKDILSYFPQALQNLQNIQKGKLKD